MFSDRKNFNPIFNNIRGSSIPLFSWNCVISTVFMGALDLFCKDEIQLFLVTVILALTLTLSDSQKAIIPLGKKKKVDPLLCLVV